MRDTYLDKNEIGQTNVGKGNDSGQQTETQKYKYSNP